MLYLFYLTLALFGFATIIAGAVSVYTWFRNRRLWKDLEKIPSIPMGAEVEFIATDPEEESPRRRLGYSEVQKKFDSLLKEAMVGIPMVKGSWDNDVPEPREAAMAFNRVRDVMAKWLEGSSVIHPTGKQCCDFLAMNPKKEVTEASPPQFLGSESAPPKFTDEMIARAVEDVSSQALSKVSSSIQMDVWQGISGRIEEKVKSTVRELLKDTLQAVADKAMAEAKEREESAKREADDEAFYQQVVAEEQSKMDALRAEEEARNNAVWSIFAEEAPKKPRKRTAKKKTKSKRK